MTKMRDAGILVFTGSKRTLHGTELANAWGHIYGLIFHFLKIFTPHSILLSPPPISAKYGHHYQQHFQCHFQTIINESIPYEALQTPSGIEHCLQLHSIFA